MVTDQIRQLVLDGTIRQAAVKEKMKTLLDDGARRVAIGQTTAEEVLRVATDEHVVVEKSEAMPVFVYGQTPAAKRSRACSTRSLPRPCAPP